MQIEKLTPMTAFVLELRKTLSEQVTLETLIPYFSYTDSYAQFLTQTNTLGMFVPCDYDGNIIDMPKKEHYASKPWCESGECKAYYDDLALYVEAKERVLFEGFTLSGQSIMHGNICMLQLWALPVTIVEDLCNKIIQLTPTAKKQIYGR